MAIKIVSDFFNKLAGELDKTYFPDVKYYRDNKNTTEIHYSLELFNNGCLTYEKLINRLAKACNDSHKNIHKIVKKYIATFGNYKYKPMTVKLLREEASKIYEKSSQGGVYKLARKHKDLIKGWGHCKGCECESPAIAKKECLVCGQPVELKKVYYQPKFVGDGIEGHPQATVYSFQVWRKKENLMKDFPKCTPVIYSGDDIEEPTFMD